MIGRKGFFCVFLGSESGCTLIDRLEALLGGSEDPPPELPMKARREAQQLRGALRLFPAQVTRSSVIAFDFKQRFR